MSMFLEVVGLFMNKNYSEPSKLKSDALTEPKAITRQGELKRLQHCTTIIKFSMLRMGACARSMKLQDHFGWRENVGSEIVQVPGDSVT